MRKEVETPERKVTIISRTIQTIPSPPLSRTLFPLKKFLTFPTFKCNVLGGVYTFQERFFKNLVRCIQEIVEGVRLKGFLEVAEFGRTKLTRKKGS